MESQFSISGFAAAEHYGAKPAYDDKVEQQDEQHIGRPPAGIPLASKVSGTERSKSFFPESSSPTTTAHDNTVLPERATPTTTFRFACHKSAGWTMPTKRHEKIPYRAKSRQLKRKLRNPKQNSFVRLMQRTYFVEDTSTHEKVWDTAGMRSDFELFADSMPAVESL